jgi:hypothetical protein
VRITVEVPDGFADEDTTSALAMDTEDNVEDDFVLTTAATVFSVDNVLVLDVVRLIEELLDKERSVVSFFKRTSRKEVMLRFWTRTVGTSFVVVFVNVEVTCVVESRVVFDVTIAFTTDTTEVIEVSGFVEEVKTMLFTAAGTVYCVLAYV